MRLEGQTSSYTEKEIPQLDEGWWNSVLTDESAFEPDDQESQVSPVDSGHEHISNVDWEYVKEVYERDEIIQLEVHSFNRGGALVKGEGIQGFVPVSHLVEIPGDLSEEDRRMHLMDYVGKRLSLKVIECEPSLERIVLSERAAQSGEGSRNQLFENLAQGKEVYGLVTNVTDFGVFVDLGGVEGLIHVSELSWGRVRHPSEILNVGQRIKTLVLQVCEDTSRVALSLKQLTENPWNVLEDRYSIGAVVSAKITAITRFGAFACLDEGIEGLIHISSIDLPKEETDMSNYLFINRPVEVKILHIDTDRRRLGLGLVKVE
jgi:small subunit ribosomal protein S1